MNCFRYLGVTALQEVEDMTLREYLLRMRANQLKRVDKDRDIHYQAWLTFVASSTKEQGNKTVPLYPKFKDFFDYDKQLKELEGVKRDPKLARLANLAAKVNG